MGSYDVALICKNGHVINGSCKRYPEHNTKFCEKCGSETINKCFKCGTEIRGDYHVEGLYGGPHYKIPMYCHNCGNLYPWTEKKLKAIDELVDLMDELNENDKKELKQSVIEITSDNPKTAVGVLKIKKHLGKVGNALAKTTEKILVQIASKVAIDVMKEQGMI